MTEKAVEPQKGVMVRCEDCDTEITPLTEKEEKKALAKFIQISVSHAEQSYDESIFALDENGRVWLFSWHDISWKMLPNCRMMGKIVIHFLDQSHEIEEEDLV